MPRFPGWLSNLVAVLACIVLPLSLVGGWVAAGLPDPDNAALARAVLTVLMATGPSTLATQVRRVPGGALRGVESELVRGLAVVAGVVLVFWSVI